VSIVKPSLGRIVHVIGVQAASNGADVAPAIITRVWNDGLINCTVFPDCAAPVPASSVSIVEDEAAARARSEGKDYIVTVAFWPPRT